MSDTQRELTLDEWCEKLPSFHRVNKELAELRAALEQAQADNSKLSELCQAQAGNYQKLQTVVERLTGELAALHDTINTAERTIDVGPYGGVLAINYMAKGIIFLREMLDKKEAELATANERIRILTEERNSSEGEDYWFHQCMKAEAELVAEKAAREHPVEAAHAELNARRECIRENVPECLKLKGAT